MTYSAATLAWAREEADRPYIERDRAQALGQIDGARLDRITAPVDPHASVRDLGELATRRADYMLDLVAALAAPVTLDWINAHLEALEARPLPEFDPKRGSVADQMEGAVKRVCCRLWWKRQIQRVAVRKREALARARGLVSHATRQPYVTDETFARFKRAKVKTEAMLKETTIESAEGDFLSLWDAMQAGVGNMQIRRGELMTRIKGAEQWALGAGMVGLFTTNTTPSAYHAMRHAGGKNPAFAGHTPAEGQAWLCDAWARTRAAIKREGLRVFGFRVAEPHHDGTPHWHMLIWVHPTDAQRLQDLMSEQWLAEAGDEPGAQQHRLKVEHISQEKGGAVAYVAKYIAKGLDDAGQVGEQGHEDQHEGEAVSVENASAARVQCWARAWGIRQFQAFGQPPVTVWRELRRVDQPTEQSASPAMLAAHAAVNKTEARRACWKSYMEAQGGAMQGRAARIKLEQERELEAGRYGFALRVRVLGVRDVKRPGECLLSNRKRWKPRGSWAPGERANVRTWGASASPQGAQPWTRVNNCTDSKTLAQRKRDELNEKARAWLLREGLEHLIFDSKGEAGGRVIEGGQYGRENRPPGGGNCGAARLDRGTGPHPGDGRGLRCATAGSA